MNKIKITLLFISLLLLIAGCSTSKQQIEQPVLINNTEKIEENINIKIIEEKTAQYVYFDPEITFSYKYFIEEGIMPYALYSPNTNDSVAKLPLIVWLHSDAENNCNLDFFFNHGLTKLLNNWQLEGFNAYVLFPHLTGKYNTTRWNNEKAVENLKELLDKIIKEYNIDINKIIVCGHSLGGQGTIYMADKLSDYFYKAVVCSGYNSYPETININIPIRAYVGTVPAGEDPASVTFTTQTFSYIFGKENVFICNTYHGGVPEKTFLQDKNNNNRSDVIEWMLE